MSKSAKAYTFASACLIGFPLLLSLWSGASAILAILLMGLAVYALATCHVVVAFWHRYHYGTWPLDFGGPAAESEVAPFQDDRDLYGARSRTPARPGAAGYLRKRTQITQAVQAWLHRFSSSA